jgi:branched-subunit amino acid aminotransferase/4-amino-4-deoxychorismate lyase
VKNSILYTPPLGTPVLPGVARKTVRELAQQQSLDVVEKDLLIADVLEADEIFLTNVIMEVLPVAGVEQHTVGSGKVGPITGRLRKGFVQAIEQQCRRQE